MSTYITVLNNGFVAYRDHMGSDLTVVNAARVSFAKSSEAMTDADSRLISFLARHRHWTPFAHAQITLHIKAPIFVRTQLFKHKVGLVENEVSRRYVTNDPEFYQPVWRVAPPESVKQGSGDFVADDDLSLECDNMIGNLYEGAANAYRELLKKGIAPEQARAALPQGAFTEWWWTGSIYAFSRVVWQRSDATAQWETRQYARAISEVIRPRFPQAWAALMFRDY